MKNLIIVHYAVPCKTNVVKNSSNLEKFSHTTFSQAKEKYFNTDVTVGGGANICLSRSESMTACPQHH